MGYRSRVMLLLVGIIALSGVVATALWFERPTVLTIAAGPPGSGERRFAERLSNLLEQNHASVRLMPKTAEPADLSILRTDARVPPHARAVAVLEHAFLLLIGPKGSELRSLAELRGHRLTVIGEDGRNEALVRQILDLYEVDAASTPLRTAPSTVPMDVLLAPGGADFVITFEPLSHIAKTRTFEELSQRMDGFALYGVSDANALERKLPGLFAEVIDAGLLSGAPRIPEQDMDTVALQELLVAREDIKNEAIVQLSRMIFENKSELAIDHLFATRIEPPDLDKDSLIAAHDGAAEYVERDEKSFFDRYSDVIYIAMSVGSVVGSLGLAIFTAATRVKPGKAGERAHDLMAITERIRAAASMAALDLAETELEDVLRAILHGLKDGTLSSDGLEAFRLAYDHARDALATRRRLLGGGLGPSRHSRADPIDAAPPLPSSIRPK